MLHDTPRRHPVRWAVATLAVSTVVLGTVACSAAPAAIALDTVGKVGGSTALVAVVAADDKLIAYVCDGGAALGERFAGTAAGGHADLSSASGAQLVVDLAADAAEGTFTALPRPAKPRADGGLRSPSQIRGGGSRESALVAGVGEIVPTRVVTNDLFKRVGDQQRLDPHAARR
jgi:hypothetical protein